MSWHLAKMAKKKKHCVSKQTSRDQATNSNAKSGNYFGINLIYADWILPDSDTSFLNIRFALLIFFRSNSNKHFEIPFRYKY
jgi:hypothetical protein